MKYFSLVLFGVWILAEMLSAQDSQTIATTNTFAARLVEAANFRTTQSVRYEPAYVVIDYPNGDVPPDTGVCSDVVIRAYRALGVDLQKLLHDDMKYNFSSYPMNWGLKRPDKNIDHRRVPNLQRFLKRKGAEIEGKGSTSYRPGDLVAWDLNGNGLWHIGIVTGENEFVHNIGGGPVSDSGIERWTVVGHYRYHPDN